MEPNQPPGLTPEQRAVVLDTAADIHARREAVVAALRSGEETLATVLDRADADEVVAKMNARALVVARLRVPAFKAEAFLEELGIPPARLVRRFSDSDRELLIDAVEGPGSGASPAGSAATNGDDLTVLRQLFAGAQLGPPAGWDKVHAFEAGQGVVLPEPYRSFVAEVGDGCADGPPDYGLVALGESPDRDGRHWQFATPGALARPFPLTEAWIWEDGGPPPTPGVDPAMVFDDGVLPLGTEGDGMYWVLVVTGEHRGQIWDINGEGASPFGHPFGGTSAAPGFTGWVSHWADGQDWYDAS
jgi:S13-like protein